MKVLVKKNPAEPMVTAAAANRICRQQVRITSFTGYLEVSLLSRALANSGDSWTPERIIRPTIISTPLARNGRRQPQARTSAGSSEVTKRKAIKASSKQAEQ